ncbi:hypothetical protein DDW10_00580 [Sulfolobales archaeon SCGC AB-777_J03]|nr:hypothetical protein DDW10_00580 [Sulfolobales archaeon SCGC AB-777_J03]
MTSPVCLTAILGLTLSFLTVRPLI